MVGRFGRPHGVKGFVTVQSFTEPRDNLLKYDNWHAFIEGAWVPVTIVRAERYNKTIVVQVKGYAERDIAARLTNIEIAVQQTQLEELSPGEYYWHQLIGMSVIGSKGEIFGQVTEIIPTGSNDVLVVQGEKRYLIPYLLGQFVLDIDPNQRQITVDWDVDF